MRNGPKKRPQTWKGDRKKAYVAKAECRVMGQPGESSGLMDLLKTVDLILRAAGSV